MNYCHLRQLSITQLFEQWRVFAHLENYWRKALERNPASDHAANKFSKWNLKRKMANAEIERRADLLEFEVVNCLIETCTNFYFHDKPGL